MERRQRLLLMLDSLAPGGAETSTVAMLPGLRDEGFEIDVAVLHDRGGLTGQVEGHGFVVHSLAGPGGRLGWVRRARKLLTEQPVDLVHTSLYEADVCGRTAAWTRRIPVVSTLASESYGFDHVGDPGLNQAKVRLGQALDASTARFAIRLHAVSDQVADSMAGRLRYPRARIDVVHRGRDVTIARERSIAERAATRTSLGVADNESIVLAVARQNRVKGLDQLIGAFPAILAAVPGAMLVIAGKDGDHSEELRRLVGSLGLDEKVCFLGHRTDVAALMHASDVFVLPSRREGLPGAVLEAMAVGVPVVANHLPQIREIAPEGQVVSVDASSVSALAAAIGDTLRRPSEAAARAERARQRFLEAFTLERSVEGMAAFYRRCL